jgi:ribosomal-protein-alanine N-acetyltransferase
MSPAEATILETRRLRLRKLSLRDAPFIVELLNDEDFLRFIGDRGVRDEEGALDYLQEGPLASYRENGFGLWMVERAEDDAAIGICGLLQRPALDAPDIGFASLPSFRGIGYGYEAARAVLDHGLGALGLQRILAVTQSDNEASISLLIKLGMRYAGTARLDPEGADLELFEIDAPGDCP